MRQESQRESVGWSHRLRPQLVGGVTGSAPSLCDQIDSKSFSFFFFSSLQDLRKQVAPLLKGFQAEVSFVPVNRTGGGGGWGGGGRGCGGAGLSPPMWLLFVLLLLLSFIFFHCFWLNIFCVVTVCHKMVVLGRCSFLSLWAPAPQMVSVRPCPRCPKRFPPLLKIFNMRLYIFHPFRKYRLIRALPETAIYC